MPNPALPLWFPAIVHTTAVAALLLSAAVAARPAQAAPPDAPAAMRQSADGLYVLEDRAKLAWPRCVEGMQWNGRTCTGEASLLTYSQAQALAHARWKAEGVRWRLPRVPELRRLVDRTRQPPMISPVLFPATPMQWHWTSTASVNTATVNPYNYGNVARGGNGEGGMQAQQGWAVDMETGEVRGTMGKGNRLPVRLVRPQP